jgi:prolyl 4-hydroxylase
MIVDMAASGADGTAARLAATPHIRTIPSRLLQQFALPGFLSADECAALIAMIDAAVRPSTIADPNGDDAFRTSMTCDLDHAHPQIAALDAALCALTGIAPRYGEALQGQRYDVGQEFKHHTDTFDPTGLDYAEHCTIPGQRTWTVMIYLNHVAAGGGTRFKSLDKIHQPECGKLLAWNNIGADGRVNPHSGHHGMKVRKGRKYVITKWYREREWLWE